MTQRRMLTGDTPTGQLHLGHWVGSVRRRVELQSQAECFVLIANMHAFTTRSEKPDEIRRDTLQIVRDYLAMGLDPEKTAIFLQTEVPAISELTYLFAMLLPYNRVMHNPTLKDEIKVKNLGDNYSFGFPAVRRGPNRDILAFRAHAVPVGEDQIPHIELTREVLRGSISSTAGWTPRPKMLITPPRAASSPFRKRMWARWLVSPAPMVSTR